MHEIVDGIVMWSWLSEPHGYNFNGYFVRHRGGNLGIDPVEPGDDVLALLRREGVARILITNRNHVRKANLVREQTGAPVAIHPADAAYARGQGAVIDAELVPALQCRVICGAANNQLADEGWPRRSPRAESSTRPTDGRRALDSSPWRRRGR